ncbi:MAG: geranylgeranyl reductase family protein [Thermoanaerobacteraceae bacterium]|nr:geranylgeranyl reductase family protein [Thermoanaerobacteraceae bacterium]
MFDVIVVGAGPAGSTLAGKLSSIGLKVMLLEKQEWPRFKPCGGGITKRCYEIMDTDISSVIEDITYSLILTLNHKIGVELISHSPIIYQADRMRFDDLLVENAINNGATFHIKEKFLDFNLNEGYINVETDMDTYKCRVLVGADGINSTVGRKAGFRKVHTGTAMEAEIGPLNKDMNRLKGKVHIDFGIIKGGYGWNFPKEDSLSIGVGTFRHRVMDIKKNLYDMLDKEGIKSSDEVYLYGHPLAFPDGKSRKYNNGNVLLVGDAAGLADPFTGEGIYYAIESARIASEVISSWFNGNEKLQRYTDRINNEIRPEIRSAYELSMFCYHFLPFVMITLKTFPAIFSYFIDVISGHDDFRYWQTKVPACMFGIKKPVSEIDLKYIR